MFVVQGRPREGGETPTYVFVSDSHFGPPDEGAKDCVMVGPGVGIAPFRAFVQDRVASGTTGRNWVFSGDQHRAYDFIYEDEWLDYLARGQVHRLDLAWSRDQAHKIHVQDKMREHAASFGRGSPEARTSTSAATPGKWPGASMPRCTKSSPSRAAWMPPPPVEYVKRMKKEKRYQRDVY